MKSFVSAILAITALFSVFRSLTFRPIAPEGGEVVKYGGAYNQCMDIFLPDHIGDRRVRVIASGAFAYYLKKGETELWSPDKIILPDGIEEIQPAAFDCAENTEIYFPSTVTSLPKDCFCAVENLTLHIPASVTEIADELGFDSGEPAFKAFYAPAGSYAEQYAKEHNIPFVAE